MFSCLPIAVQRLGLLVAFLSVTPAQAARQYIPVPLGPGSAAAINAEGQVAAESVVYTPGQPPIDFRGVGIARITAINNAGSVAGAGTAGGWFLYADGVLTQLRPSTFPFRGVTSVRGLDDSDTVSGDASEYGTPLAFRYSAGSFQFTGYLVSAKGASAAGWITGEYINPHAFRWFGNTFSNAHPPFAGATTSAGLGINDAGDVTGSYSGAGFSGGFVLAGSEYIDLGRCLAGRSINNARAVVGHGCAGLFFYAYGDIRDLNRLVPFGSVTLESVAGINDAAQIAATGKAAATEPLSAFRLEPIERYVDRGDFDGDMRTDLLWRNTATGATATWLMKGTQPWQVEYTFLDPLWRVTDVADFNGDERSDLLWRNTTTGEVAIWLRNGLGTLAARVVSDEPEWVVTHVADFDGNSKADLLWRNASTGATRMWLMDGVWPETAEVIFADGNWRVTHVADLDGDGKSDLVWRNELSGATAAWLMDGASALAWRVIFTDAAWKVTHTGDLDSDGRADLVWRNDTTGATAIWLMEGLAPTESTAIFIDPDWSVSMVTNLDSAVGDRHDDLVWRNRLTGETAFWFMVGTAARSAEFASLDPQWVLTNVLHPTAVDSARPGRYPAFIWRHAGDGRTVSSASSPQAGTLLLGDPNWVIAMPSAK